MTTAAASAERAMANSVCSPSNRADFGAVDNNFEHLLVTVFPAMVEVT